MLYVILAVIVVFAFLALSSVWDIIERLKVLEYEQNRQFNVIIERLDMLQGDIDDLAKETFNISCGVDEIKPPKQKIDPFLSFPPDD